MEQLYDASRSIRTVEAGEHGLKKVDEWTTEHREEFNEETGFVEIKPKRRRKRGKCHFCKRKTSWFCPACPTPKNSSRYWCCGPDTSHGRDCQAKHDTEWVFVEVE